MARDLPHGVTKRKLKAIAKALVFVLGALLLFLLGLYLGLGGGFTEAGGVAAGHRGGKAFQYRSIDR